MAPKLLNHPDHGTGWARGTASESPDARAAWDRLLAEQAQAATPRIDDPAQA